MISKKSIKLLLLSLLLFICSCDQSKNEKTTIIDKPTEKADQPVIKGSDIPQPEVKAENKKKVDPELNKKLLKAALDGEMDSVSTLIEQGADINCKGSWKVRPLHNACINNHFEVAKFLIEKGADINAEETNRKTPLHVAAEKGHLEIVKLLIENNTEIDSRDLAEHSALSLAARHDHFEVVKFLVQKGADVNIYGHDLSPLMAVLSNRNYDLAKLLIENGADIHIKEHTTALHIASVNLNIEMVKLLLERGAKINTQNHKGETPLLRLCKSEWNTHIENPKRFEIIKLFVAKGADLNILDNSEQSALDVVGAPELKELLIKNGAKKGKGSIHSR